MATATAPKQLDLAQRVLLIAQGSQSRQLDPLAVLSVALHEGLAGNPGDYGKFVNNTFVPLTPGTAGGEYTSFGPFQMHISGALPASVSAQGTTYAQAWANSAEGINYALDGVASVAKGQQGAQAISSIVTGFERPAASDLGGEIAAATSSYTSGATKTISDNALKGVLTSGGLGVQSGSVAASVGGAASGAVGAVTGAVTSTGDFLAKISSTAFLIRALEVVGGAILAMAGLYLLAKQIGLAAPAPGPVGAVAAAV